MRRGRLSLLWCLVVAGTVRADDSGFVLSTDPFRKPVLQTVTDFDVPETLVAAPPEPEKMPELHGILRSPRATLVNLNGELIAVGGRYQRFTVVAVGERNAVLLDGEERHVVSIDDDRDETDAKRDW